MPNTPNRFFPYPGDGDGVDVADDIENLATAVDTDNAAIANSVLVETAARTTAINAILAGAVHSVIHGIAYNDNIGIEGGYIEATLDMFAVHVLEFTEAFNAAPVVIVTPAASSQTIDVGVEYITTTTCNVFGRVLADGEPAFFQVAAYYWLAIGQRVPG